MSSYCYSCTSELSLPMGAVGMSATCDRCRADVHVCRNCKFYDPKAYNECHEPQAERVVEKDRRNRCDFFVLAIGPLGSSNVDAEKAAAKKKLEDLFK